MIVKGYIERNLKELNRLYLKTNDPYQASYYSKLSVIELSGWIEETIDAVFIRLTRKKIKNDQLIKEFEEEIKRVNGFLYKKHIRSLIKSLLGIKGCESFEIEYNNNGELTILEGILSNLKGKRDGYAHTYIKSPVTTNYLAPSVILGFFYQIVPLLKSFEKILKKIS